MEDPKKVAFLYDSTKHCVFVVQDIKELVEFDIQLVIKAEVYQHDRFSKMLMVERMKVW